MDKQLFSDLVQVLPMDPDLSEGERQTLRVLAVSGGPIWKIVKSGLDYAQYMKDHIAAIPLVTAEQIASARQLQLQREAALNFLRWFVQSFAPPAQKENDNG